MTLYDICDNVRRTARRAGAIADDDQLTLSQINLWVREYRAKSILLMSEYGKEWSMLTQIKQDYGCQDLRRVDISECSYKWGKNVLKLCDLPKAIEMPEHRSTFFVGTIGRNKGFNYAEPSSIDDKLNTRYGDKFGYWWENIDPSGNLSIYVVPPDTLKDIRVIKVERVFFAPEEVNDCIRYDINLNCSPDYPLIAGSVTDITMQILTRELGVALQTTKDVMNNANTEV